VPALNVYVCVRQCGLFYVYSKLTHRAQQRLASNATTHTYRESSLSACTQSCEWMFYAHCATCRSWRAFLFYAFNQPCTLAVWCACYGVGSISPWKTHSPCSESSLVYYIFFVSRWNKICMHKTWCISLQLHIVSRRAPCHEEYLQRFHNLYTQLSIIEWMIHISQRKMYIFKNK